MEYKKIGDIKSNPNNPRILKDDKFKKLVHSIKEFPEMLEKRPIVVNNEMFVLGGNMRLKACKEAGLKEIPVIVADWTEKQQREFIIKDNVGFGEWNWDQLANEWDNTEIESWGLDIPSFKPIDEQESEEPDENEEEGNDETDFFVPDCIYNSNNIYEIPTLKIENQATELILPLKPYGAEARTNGGVGTYHFYVDDYRFEAIWKNPINILKSGCTQIVEPNLSLYDTTPVSYGLFLIYKKRWLARFLQEKGFNIYADLNVSNKFIDYNQMGIPEGYNSFFTRGYTGRLSHLKEELEVAKKISGKKEPNLIVYGGSNEIKEFCYKSNLVFIKDYVNSK